MLNPLKITKDKQKLIFTLTKTVNLEYNIFDMINCGDRIKTLREKNRLSQSMLSKKLGITTMAISSYENGRIFPSINILTKIADLFDVSVDYLLGRVEDPNPYDIKAEVLPSYLKLLPIYLYTGKEKIDISNFPDKSSLSEYGTVRRSVPANYGLKVLNGIYLLPFADEEIIWIDSEGKEKLDTGMFALTIVKNEISVRETFKDINTGMITLVSFTRGEEPIIFKAEDINKYVIGRVFEWYEERHVPKDLS
jgi:transcriptional regulator with XRE-family HTH domain